MLWKCDCCDGDCLCCSCVERVYYYPSVSGASAKPFAGILPSGGAWQFDSASGYYYGEFPCHYVEYAFSEYAASIFPNAVNAGADAAYSGGGTWARVTIDYYYEGYYYFGTTGETRCKGSTEANCQPCLAYPGTLPSGDPLPTLAQLQAQCGIYHPCTPCEVCSEQDGCGVPGTNRSQSDGATYPGGIPWPPPDGTCPCRPCDRLCLERVEWCFYAKPVASGSSLAVYGYVPESVPQIPTQPSSVWQVWSGTEGYYDIGWECRDPMLTQYGYPLPANFGWRTCGPSENGVYFPPSGDGRDYPENYPEGWQDELYPWRVYYYRIRVSAACCDCSGVSTSGEETIAGVACGGIVQLQSWFSQGFYDLYDQIWPIEGCPTPTSCGTPCWDAPTECNPFP